MCSLGPVSAIGWKICLQPYIYQVSLLLGGLNKNLVYFLFTQNYKCETEKVGLQLFQFALLFEEQRCLFQSSADEIQNCLSIGGFK